MPRMLRTVHKAIIAILLLATAGVGCRFATSAEAPGALAR